jgi:aminoglycoside phosphotransferase (APT) family kinase protein
VKPADSEALARRLSRSLPGEPEVRVTGVASLGAQRQTLFLELGPPSAARRAVVQISSQVIAPTSVESESQLLRAARQAGVPVAEILAVDADERAIVSSHVEGETIPRRILRRVEANPALGDRLTADCGRALAAIHSIPTASLPDLEDLTSPLRYVEQLERLLDSLPAPMPAFRLGLRWLERNRPAADAFDRTRASVVHGDFRLGNFIATDDGLVAVLDWELAHLGDPMEDLAWLCLRTWRFGLDHNEVGGFGSLAALRSAYQAAGGEWRPQAFAWWSVARTLWWGLGLARQTQAFLDGASDSSVLAASGRRVAELEYDLLCAIAPETD